MTFDLARETKFIKGRREHGADSPFDAAHIDWRKEAQDELCDLSNYMDLCTDEAFRKRVQLWCRDTWQEIEESKG